MTSIPGGRKRPATARRRPPRERSMRSSDANDQGRTRSSDVSLHVPRRLAARALPAPPRLPAAAWTPRLVAALLARLATRLRRTRRRGHRLAQALLELAQASGQHVRRDPTQLWCRSVNRHGPSASSRTTWSPQHALPCLSLRRAVGADFVQLAHDRGVLAAFADAPWKRRKAGTSGRGSCSSSVSTRWTKLTPSASGNVA
jgi:hypothetical protein